MLQKKEEELLQAGAVGTKLEEGEPPPEEQRIVEGQRDDTVNTEGTRTCSQTCSHQDVRRVHTKAFCVLYTPAVQCVRTKARSVHTKACCVVRVALADGNGRDKPMRKSNATHRTHLLSVECEGAENNGNESMNPNLAFICCIPDTVWGWDPPVEHNAWPASCNKKERKLIFRW